MPRTKLSYVAIVGANAFGSCWKPATRMFMKSFRFHAA